VPAFSTKRSEAEVAMRWLVVLLPILLGGCGGSAGWPLPGTGADDPRNVYPVNYRTDTIAFMRTYLNDPTQVRDAFMSEPVLRMVRGEARYVACLRYNAKNSRGEYSGSKDRLAIFLGGRFDTLTETTRDMCSGAAYAPFTELERLSR
jgi:hypothetical protein